MMAWVDTYEECEKCGGEDTFFSSLNCRTGEEYCMCLRCGTNRATTADRDEEGNFVLSDDGKLRYTYKEELTGGAFAIRDENRVGQLGHLPPDFSDEQVEELKQQVKEADLVIEFLSVWRDSKLVVLIDERPPEPVE